MQVCYDVMEEAWMMLMMIMKPKGFSSCQVYVAWILNIEQDLSKTVQKDKKNLTHNEFRM